MNTTIRQLKYKDRKTLSAMIRKLTEKIGDDSLLNQIKADPDKLKDDTKKDDQALIQMGMNLFNHLFQFLEDEMAAWFADLIGVDIETFLNESPFDIEIIILNQLMDDKGQFRSFLAGASKLYKSILGSVNNLKTQKDK